MRLSVKREEFLRILRDVQGAVQPRSTMPILSHVKIESGEAELRLTATDMALAASEAEGIESSASAQVLEAGSLTAPAAQLSNIIQKLPEKCEIIIAKEGEDFVTVKSRSSKFKLRSLPVSDFPSIDEPKNPTTFGIAAAALTRLFAQTAFSMSRDEIRYYLNGVYLHAAEDKGGKVLRSVATDGHRMAISQLPAPAGSEKMAAGIIPAKAVKEFASLFSDKKGDMEVAISKNLASFSMGKVRLITRLIEGSFPEYGKVVPEEKGQASLTVNAADLAKMVERVCAVSDEPIRAISVTLEGGRVRLEVAAPDNAAASDSMDVKHRGDMRIGFNSQYLLDVLRQIEGGEAHLSLNGDSKPSRISAQGKDNPLYILMPMRI